MSQFQDLLKQAKNEPQKQQLLFLFAQATNMFEGEQKNYNSGTINPVICVDKNPEELTSFAELVEEADSFTKGWNFILVSSISGKNGVAPTAEEIDQSLKQMSNGIASGEDLSNFVVWNRKEESILIS